MPPMAVRTKSSAILGRFSNYVTRLFDFKMAAFAVNSRKSGGEIKDLQKILGHHHLRMTEEPYGRFKTSNVDFFDVEAVPGTGVSESDNDKFREF